MFFKIKNTKTTTSFPIAELVSIKQKISKEGKGFFE